MDELKQNKIVIVAGFQGVSLAKEITTLGRGGSDTSAVALASYLKAEKCEIYTDVDGVFTADPRIVPDAHLLKVVDYDEMLALAYNGSKVLHPRAVEFALKYKIPVEVKSSFTFSSGTMIVHTEESSQLIIKEIKMEDRKITAIAHKDDLICYRLHTSDRLGALLHDWVHEIYKYQLMGDHLELYIESKYDKEIERLLVSHGFACQDKTPELGYVTLVGIGINLDLPFLNDVWVQLTAFGVIQITHTERTIEILLPNRFIKECVQLLHEKFCIESVKKHST